MSGSSRVAWREGQFLRPQHFQQADRSIDARLRARADMLGPHAWGVSEVKIDEDLAALGKFTVVRMKGVMPDGVAFSIPEDLPPPPPLDVPPDTRDATIYLTLPAAQEGGQEFADAETAGPDIRYLVGEAEVVDCFSADRTREPLELARPHLRFGVTRDQTYGRVLCGLAHVREMQGGRVLIDDRYNPPAQDIAAS